MPCIRFGAHVPRQYDSIPAVGLDFGDQACKLGFTPSADDQLRPLRGKEFRCRPADAGAGTRNEGYFILQTSHGGTPAGVKGRRGPPSIKSYTLGDLDCCTCRARLQKFVDESRRHSRGTTMTDPTTQPIKIDGYHAHVYYDAETRPRAERLRETIAATLGVEVRELSDEPRGPHPVPQFRFTFTTAQFENVVPWLMLNREGLDVLVHPLSDNSYDDHSRYAVWLGSPVALKLNTMRRTYRAEQYTTPR